MTQHIKYEFSCGCISTKSKRIYTKTKAQRTVCCDHEKPVKFKYIPCMDGCGEYVKGKPTAHVKLRCPKCRKIYAKNSNKLRMRDSNEYTTADEIRHIKKMKPEIAKKYLPAIECHVEWPGFDKNRCIEVCRQQAGVM